LATVLESLAALNSAHQQGPGRRHQTMMDTGPTVFKVSPTPGGFRGAPGLANFRTRPRAARDGLSP